MGQSTKMTLIYCKTKVNSEYDVIDPLISEIQENSIRSITSNNNISCANVISHLVYPQIITESRNIVMVGCIEGETQREQIKYGEQRLEGGNTEPVRILQYTANYSSIMRISICDICKQDKTWIIMFYVAN